MRHNRKALSAVGLAWLILVILALVELNKYTHKPGAAAGSVPASWPTESTIAKSIAATLLVFLHPECTCSRATLGELDRLLAHAPQALVTYAIMPSPIEGDPLPSLWVQAASLPGVKVFADNNRSEAELFKVQTSGHVLLYDHINNLAFSGGITPSRGHRGDSEGHQALLRILLNQTSPLTRSATFGCALAAGPLTTFIAGWF